MQFVADPPFYKLARITGPQHNLLVLKLSPVPVSGEIGVEKLDINLESTNPIVANAVRDQVIRAMNDHHIQHGARNFVELMQYLESDSPPVETYYLLTREILRRVDKDNTR